MCVVDVGWEVRLEPVLEHGPLVEAVVVVWVECRACHVRTVQLGRVGAVDTGWVVEAAGGYVGHHFVEGPEGVPESRRVEAKVAEDLVWVPGELDAGEFLVVCFEVLDAQVECLVGDCEAFVADHS